MSNHVTIDGIPCYGEYAEDSNVIVVGTDSRGHVIEEVWCGDSYPDDDDRFPQNWTEAVRDFLKPWAEREGITLEELSSC